MRRELSITGTMTSERDIRGVGWAVLYLSTGMETTLLFSMKATPPSPSPSLFRTSPPPPLSAAPPALPLPSRPSTSRVLISTTFPALSTLLAISPTSKLSQSSAGEYGNRSNGKMMISMILLFYLPSPPPPFRPVLSNIRTLATLRTTSIPAKSLPRQAWEALER